MKGSKITNHRNFPVDGCLPDIDYSLMRMKNLDDLDLDKVLMEYESVHIQRTDQNSDSKFNITLTSSNPEIFGKQHYEDVFVETENSRNGIKSGDQVIQIDGVSVRNLKQANELLERSGKTASLLLLRPVKVFNLDCDQSICIPQNNELINKTYIKSKIIQSPRTFPHMVYTTPDRLKQTIWLQQNILLEKLNLLSKINCDIDNDSNHVKPTNSNMNKNENNTTTDNQTEKPGVTNSPHQLDPRTTCSSPVTSWRIRRSADGTRYITKKYKRPSEFLHCKSSKLNANDQYLNSKHPSVSRTNSSCCEISEKHKTSGNQSKSLTNLENVNSPIHLYHVNNMPTVNTVTSSESNLVKQCKIKFGNSEILQMSNVNMYDIQSNIPTSILIKPPILFRRSQSASISRNNNNNEKKNTKSITNNLHHSLLYNTTYHHHHNNKQGTKFKLNTQQTSVSVVTI